MVVKVYTPNEVFILSYPSDKVFRCTHSNNELSPSTNQLNFRKLFIPHSDDCYYVSFDYSQVLNILFIYYFRLN